MSKKDLDDLLQLTIKKDGEYQRQLVDAIELKNKEIERLKEEKEKLFNHLLNDKLQQRINKAIEYIEEALKDDCSEFMYMYEPEEILKILKGE